MILKTTKIIIFRATRAEHGSGKIYFIGTFLFFIGTLHFIYCRNRKIPNHATSWLKKNLAVPYKKNKQNSGQRSADAVVENLTPITTADLGKLNSLIIYALANFHQCPTASKFNVLYKNSQK
jgi:hypothetical protein